MKSEEKKAERLGEMGGVSGATMAGYLRQIADALADSRKTFTAKITLQVDPDTAPAERGEPESAAPKCPKCGGEVVFGLLSHDVKGIVAYCVREGHRFPLYDGLRDCAQFFPTPALPSVEELAREVARGFYEHTGRTLAEVTAEIEAIIIRSLREKGQQ